MEQEKENIVVIRVKRDLRKRLSELSKKKKTTLISLTNKAIEEYLDEEEYSFNDLLNVINKIPNLKVHKDVIEKEFKDCPNRVCKEIIDTIEDKDSFIFEETFETISDKLKSLDFSKVFGLFFQFFMVKIDINKVNEVLQKLGDFIKNDKVVINVGATESKDQDKILLFVSYDKKEEGDTHSK